MKSIAILASGSGSNAEEFFRYFQNHSTIRVKALFTNNPSAFAIKRAEKFQTPVSIFNRSKLYGPQSILDDLNEFKIDYIVLAGFMLLIPEVIVNHFTNRIVNIHPALLPKYGGKGMFGDRVHAQVIENQDTESGITIHLVNEQYDEGQILFQDKCRINPNETVESLAQKIHSLEHKHYPRIVEKHILEDVK